MDYGNILAKHLRETADEIVTDPRALDKILARISQPNGKRN